MNPNLEKGNLPTPDAWYAHPKEVPRNSLDSLRRAALNRKVELAEFWDNFWSTEPIDGLFVPTSDNLVPLSSLPKLLRSFLLIMAMFGLYHYSEESLSSLIKRKAYKKAVPVVIGKAMSIVCIIFVYYILAFNLHHFPWNESGFQTHTFTSIVYFCWFLQNAIAATVYFVASYRKTSFPKLFGTWEKILFPKTIASQIDRYCSRIQWLVLGGILLGTIIFLAVFVQVYFVDYDLQVDLIDNDPEAALPNTSKGEVYTLGVLAILSIPICCFSVGFFALICTVLSHVFQKSSDFLHRTVRSNPEWLNLEGHRWRHEQICQALEVADSLFSFLIFSFFATYMLLIVIIGYEFLAISSPTDVKLVRAFWCVFGMFTLSAICIVGATVNTAAIKTEKYLHLISLKHPSHQRDIQLVTFLLRFRGSYLGFTAWNMFTLTRGLILSVASIFMTYLLLLVQLQPAQDHHHYTGRNHTYHRNGTSGIGYKHMQLM